jgi:hypothetical protein
MMKKASGISIAMLEHEPIFNEDYQEAQLLPV